MVPDPLFDNASTHPWWQNILEDRVTNAPTMVSLAERKLLYWLAINNILTENGCIVDAGCFLGGSTLALAAGLNDNESEIDKTGRIFAYDIFVASAHPYTLGLAGSGKKQGDLLVDVFLNTMGELHPLVTTVCGDFHISPPPDRPIDILFIDVAKTWSLNARAVQSYFPLLQPGSIVVQQDHNDHACPWVYLTMAYFSEFFDYIIDEQSSRVYRLKRKIPEAMLQTDLQALSYATKMKLLKSGIELSETEHARFLGNVTGSWIVAEQKGAQAAQEYLTGLNIEQPWESDTPYIDVVKAQIAYKAKG